MVGLGPTLVELDEELAAVDMNRTAVVDGVGSTVVARAMHATAGRPPDSPGAEHEAVCTAAFMQIAGALNPSKELTGRPLVAAHEGSDVVADAC